MLQSGVGSVYLFKVTRHHGLVSEVVMISGIGAMRLRFHCDLCQARQNMLLITKYTETCAK